MEATIIQEAWDELALISVLEQGGAETAFEGIVEDISAIDFGEKDIESLPMVSGGNVVRKIPMSQESITLTMIPIGAGFPTETTATGIMQLFHPGTNESGGSDDATVPITVPNTLFRRKYKLTILWSTTLPADAVTLPAAGDYAKRIEIFNAYLTTVNHSFDDKILKVEATFKWSPFQKDGTRNMIVESTDDTAQLSAVIGFPPA